MSLPENPQKDSGASWGPPPYGSPGTPGQQTLIQSTRPGAFSQYGAYVHGVPPAAGTALMAWSISALVLGILSALVYAMICIGSAAVTALGHTSLGGLMTVIGIGGLIVAIAFIAGAIGALMRKDWGRQTVAAAAVGALVVLIVDFTLNLMQSSAPSAALSPFGQGVVQGAHFGAFFGDLAKMVYCALILRFMLSRGARDVTTP